MRSREEKNRSDTKFPTTVLSQNQESGSGRAFLVIEEEVLFIVTFSNFSTNLEKFPLNLWKSSDERKDEKRERIYTHYLNLRNTPSSKFQIIEINLSLIICAYSLLSPLRHLFSNPIEGILPPFYTFAFKKVDPVLDIPLYIERETFIFRYSLYSSFSLKIFPKYSRLRLNHQLDIYESFNMNTKDTERRRLIDSSHIGNETGLYFYPLFT